MLITRLGQELFERLAVYILMWTKKKYKVGETPIDKLMNELLDNVLSVEKTKCILPPIGRDIGCI